MDLLFFSFSGQFRADGKNVHLFENLIRVELLDVPSDILGQKKEWFLPFVFQSNTVNDPTVLKSFQKTKITWVFKFNRYGTRLSQIFLSVVSFR
jgi:hypothetical protein